MEQALRIRPEMSQAELSAQRTSGETLSEGIEKVLRFANPPRPGESEKPAASPFTARDFAAALDHVRDAAEAMKAAEDRTRESEGRTHTIAQRAAEELKNAELRIQSLEGRLRAAESRAAEAEARAVEAETWLRQIFTTISEELPVRRG